MARPRRSGTQVLPVVLAVAASWVAAAFAGAWRGSQKVPRLLKAAQLEAPGNLSADEAEAAVNPAVAEASEALAAARQKLEEAKQAMSPAAGKADDVVGGNTTGGGGSTTPGDTRRPALLLESRGFQDLLLVLAKLKDAPGPRGGSGLQALLGNLPLILDTDASQMRPDLKRDLQTTIETLTEQLPVVLEEGPEGDWQLPLRNFAKTPLAKRLPDIVESVINWDVVYPEEVVLKTQVLREEVKIAFRSCAEEIDFEDLTSWSEDELEELRQLMFRNALLKEVLESIGTSMDKEFQTNTAVLTAAFATPFVLLVLAIAACCGCFSGGGSGTLDADLQSLPIYRLER